jgi:hypothetical protein
MLLKSLSLRHRAFRISLTAADPAPWPTSYKFEFYNGGPSFSRPIARTADPAHPIFFFKRSGLATAVDSFVAARLLRPPDNHAMQIRSCRYFVRVIALFRKRINDMKKATRELSRGAFRTNCRSAPVPFVLLKTNKFPARGLLLVLGRAKRRMLPRALLVACQVDPAVTHRRRFRIISHSRQGLCPQQSSNRIDPCVPHYALNYLNQVSRLSCPLMTCPQPCRN